MASINKFRALSPNKENIDIINDLNNDNVKEHEKNNEFFQSAYKALFLYTLVENDEEVTGLVGLMEPSDIKDLADASLSQTDFTKSGVQLDLIPVVYPDHRRLPKLLAWHVSRNYFPRYQFTKDGVTHTIRAIQNDLDTDDMVRSLVCFKDLQVLNDNGDAAAIASTSASGKFAAILIPKGQTEYASKFCSGLLNFKLDEE